MWASPAQCRGCTDRDPGASWTREETPAPGGRVVIRTFLNSQTGYGQYAEWIGRGLAAMRVPVAYEAIQTDEQFLPLSAELSGRRCDARFDAWELLFAPPPLPLAPQKATVAVTMWETTRLPPGSVDGLNRTRAVILPSLWCAEVFSANGLAAPLHVIPPGISPEEFAPAGPAPTDVCRFGASGRMLHGAPRKGIEQVVEAFLRAFPTEPDARLSVKIWPDCPLAPVDDPRVEVIRTPLTTAALADWYRSLTVYVSASRGEGFGLQPLQAMACGRAVIATAYSGHAMYLDETVGYPVAFDFVPAEGYYRGLGHWGKPRLSALIERMREVYEHRDGARALGIAAARRAGEFTWERTASSLLHTLTGAGMLARPDGPSSERAESFDAVVLTVARPEPYLAGTLESLGRGSSVTVMVGSTDADYLSPLRDDPARRFEIPSPEEYAAVAGSCLHQRANWNYWRCLGQARSGRRLLILEDDLRFAKGWRAYLDRVVREIERHHRDYILTLYRAGQLPPASGSLHTALDPRGFFGAQGLLYAGRVASDYAAFLYERGVARCEHPHDLLLGRYAVESGTPIFATLPSLIQHVGECSTGLSGALHWSESYVDDLAALGGA